MENVAVAVLLLLFFVGILGFFIYLELKTKRAWTEAAGAMNLELVKGGLFSRTKWTLVGSYKGRQVESWMRKEKRRSMRFGNRSGGRNSSRNTQTIVFSGARVKLNASWEQGPDIQMVGMAKKAFGFLADKVMGNSKSQDARNSVLGGDFEVHGVGTPEVMARLQDPNVQAVFHRWKTKGATQFTVQEGWMSVERQETYRDPAEIVSLVDDLIYSADKIDGTGENASASESFDSQGAAAPLG